MNQELYFRELGLDPPEEDIGYVGEVVDVNTHLLHTLMEKGYIPVIAPVGVGEGGEAYNINADMVASEIAARLKAQKVIFMTNTEGVKDREGRLIPTLTKDETLRLIREGVIKGGMIPKVRSALRALEKGVKKVHIIDGRKAHALLLEIFTDEGIGTEIKLA